MSKTREPRREGRTKVLPSADLTGVLQGQIAELCHELASQGKRNVGLQQQAEELREAFRVWLAQPGAGAATRIAVRHRERR